MTTKLGPEITFTKKPKVRGDSQIAYNVTREGHPFGQLWTWPNTRSEWDPWHAQTLTGEYKAFGVADYNVPGGKIKALKNAQEWIIHHAGG